MTPDDRGAPAAAQRWLVACLCAAWCRTCDEYRPTFEAVSRANPDMRFAWIDIEDDSDALGPLALEVEDFPSVLVARGGEVRFYGALLPHAETLARTIAAARHAVLTPPVDGLDDVRTRHLHDVGERI
ncbi:MAG TPA: thioredoxin family protein [Caldimonas sp.]|nr:thioredoxin family protein [Caldimonas sp.]